MSYNENAPVKLSAKVQTLLATRYKAFPLSKEFRETIKFEVKLRAEFADEAPLESFVDANGNQVTLREPAYYVQERDVKCAIAGFFGVDVDAAEREAHYNFDAPSDDTRTFDRPEYAGGFEGQS